MVELAGRLVKKLGIGAIAVGIAADRRDFSQRDAQDIALPDVQTLGPQTGAKVPDFTLADQHGQPRSLQSLMGPNGLMLVFSRRPTGALTAKHNSPNCKREALG